MTTAAIDQGSLPSSTPSVGFRVAQPSKSENRALGTTQQDNPSSTPSILPRESNNDSSNNSSPSDDLDGGDNIVVTAPIGGGAVARIPDSVSDDSVDSALLAALRDQRERLGLLKLEQVLIDFVNSTDSYWDVGGPYNSRVVSPTRGLLSNTNDSRPQTTFQRCLLHRLADRFMIRREPGVDGLIRLCKTLETKKPKKLLLNLDSSEYNLEEKMDQMNISQPQPKTKSNRKMKIMKRNSSNVSNNSENSRSTPRKGKKDYSDKEKAYAEARARIFKDEESSPPTAPTMVPSNQQGSNLAGSTYVAAAPSSAPVPRSNPSYITPAASEFSDEKTGGGMASKATWRNRRQEENDPDFQRGGSMVMPQYDYYGSAPATTNPYGSYGQPAPQQDYYGGYYSAAGRGRGRGGRGYYHPTMGNHYAYRRSHSGNETPANVNSLEEFPSLR